jgi:hypothetical protein
LAWGTEVRFNDGVPPLSDLDELPAAALKELITQLLSEVAALKRSNAELRCGLPV